MKESRVWTDDQEEGAPWVCCPPTPVVFHGKTLLQKPADEGSDWDLGLGPSHAAARPQVEQRNKDVKKVDEQ